MRYKFLIRKKEIIIDNLNSFIELVKSGQIDADTLLYDEENSAFKKASEVVEYKKALEIKEFNNLRDSVFRQNVQEKPVGLQEVERTSKKSLMTISIILVVVALIFELVSTNKYLSGWSIGGLLVILLISALVSFLVWKLFLKGDLGNWILIFSVILLIASGYQLITAVKDYQGNQKALQYFKVMYESALNDNSDTEKKIKETIDKKVLDRFKNVSAIVENYVLELQTDARDLNGEVSKLGMEYPYTAKTLGSVQSITSELEKLNKYSGILDSHESLINLKCENTGKKLNDLKFNSGLKKQVIAGYTAGKDYMISQHSKLFDLERRSVKGRTSLLEFMKSIHGKYSIMGQTMIFQVSTDEDKYNNYLQNIKNISDDESSLKKEVQDKVLEDLNNIK